MKFKMIHENYNVSDLDRSIKFYNEALDLHEVRRKTTDDFIIVYLSNDVSDFELELTWLKDHPQPYNLGNREPTDGMMQWLSQRTAAKYSLPMNLLIL